MSQKTIGDLEESRTVFYTTNGGRRTYHLSEECRQLEKRHNGINEIEVGKCWDDDKICSLCTDSMEKVRPTGSRFFKKVMEEGESSYE